MPAPKRPSRAAEARSIRFPPAVYAEAQAAAEREGITLSAYVVRVVDEATGDRRQWVRIEPPLPPACDLCLRLAVWGHPEGGFRCAKCPTGSPARESP